MGFSRSRGGAAGRLEGRGTVLPARPPDRKSASGASLSGGAPLSPREPEAVGDGRNPFRERGRRFPSRPARVVGYFALIVVAAAINTLARRRRLRAADAAGDRCGHQGLARAAAAAAIRPSAPGERRILVIANETVGGTPLREVIHRRAEGVEEPVRVVCPALCRRFATSRRTRTARGLQQERLERSSAGCASLASRRRARSARRGSSR